MCNVPSSNIITPRMARDYSKMRDELDKRMASIAVEKDELLFDLYCQREHCLFNCNQNLFELECNLWDFIRKTFTQKDTTSQTSETVKSMFSFSCALCEIFSICDPDKFDLLKDNTLLSFSLPGNCQKEMSKDLYRGIPDMEKDSNAYHTKFWSCFLNIFQATPAELCSYRLGLLPELTHALLNKPYLELIDFLMRTPIRLTLRCSEEVVANILFSDDAEQEKALLELKYLQIISGCRINGSYIADKFVKLKEMEAY